MHLDLPPVPPLDTDAAAAAAVARQSLPVGALGVWGSVIDLLAAARGSAAGPVTPARERLVVFAADHDIAGLQISAALQEETLQRATDLTRGVGLAALLAVTSGVGVRVVDVGMTEGLDVVPVRADGVRPAHRLDTEDAMTEDELTVAVNEGIRIADMEIDSGADLLIGATCGVGISTPVAAPAALTGMEPVDATSRGSGINDEAWIRKAAAVRDALFRVRRGDQDVLRMLRIGGGPDLAALTGFIAQAAIRRTPVLIHDMPSTVAAVLAHRLAPGADSYVLVTSLAPDRGHRRLLDLLGREPLTDWSLTGHSGVGALLVVPALCAATQAFDAIDRTAAPRARSAAAITGWDPDLL